MTQITKIIYNIKIILLGETGVGKTNLINAYFGNSFNPNNLTTTNPNQSHGKLEI
jgi:GTPase SAR1 family protein